jgi:hypothetical protein
MLNVNNTTVDRSNLVYLPATYVLGDIIVNGKLSASGGVFEIDKSILASDSAIRITNTMSPSTVLIVEQRNSNHNIAEFNFGIAKTPVFYIGNAGVSVNTSVLDTSNALTVNGDISANKNLKLVNSSILNIGDVNLYRSAADTLKTDDNFVVGTLATSTADNNIIVENTGTLRKRTVNSRVWDTAATFLSGSSLTSNRLVKSDGSNRLISTNITDDGTLISSTIAASISSSSSVNPALRIVNTGTSDSFVVFDESPESSPFVITNTGNVGIGTTSTSWKLDVQGGRAMFAAASEQYAVGSRYSSSGGAVYFGANNATSTPDAVISAAGGTTLMTLQNGGNVGIGTTTPNEKLTVVGGISSTNGYFSNGSFVGSTLELIADRGSNNGPFIDFKTLGNEDYDCRLVQENNGLQFSTGGNGAAMLRMTILSGGNVGIGTSTPTEKLEVAGNLKIGGSTTENYISFAGTFGDNANLPHTFIMERLYGGSGTEKSELLLAKGNDADNITGQDRIRMVAGSILFDTYSNSVPLQVVGSTMYNLVTAGSTKMIIASSGNVGIGTINPDTNCGLHVVGNIADDFSIKIENTNPNGYSSLNLGKGADQVGIWRNGDLNTGYAGASSLNLGTIIPSNIGFHTNNSTKMFISSGGNVGIGTVSPSTRLHVEGVITLGSYQGIVSRNNLTNTFIAGGSGWDQGGEIYLSGPSNSDGGIVALSTGSTNTGGTNTERMRINSSGNVGIGTTTPNQRLTVSGNISASEIIYSKQLIITPALSSDAVQDFIVASPNNSLDATFIANNATQGSWNPLSKLGDKGLFFSSGSKETGNLIIGPWSDSLKGIYIQGSSGFIGINKNTPTCALDISGSLATTGNLSISGGTLFVGRQDSSSEGGEIRLGRSVDNAHSWSIDALGSTVTPNLRIFNIDSTGVGRVRMVIDALSGNVGIGTSLTPSFPLSFGTTVGNKIALYDAGSGNGFGFGIQSLTMQIFSQVATSRVGIGYGNSSAFTETLTVKGSNVGIGHIDPNARFSLSTTSSGQLSGNAASSIFKIYGGSLGSTISSRIKLASIGFGSSNQSSLGIEALRVSDGTDWNTTAIGLKMDVDNTSSVNNTEIWLRSNGCIGIGTSSPNSKLTVNGAISSNANILFAQGTTSNNGLVFGSDTTLYRSAADTLKTDDNFVVGTLATSTADNSIIVENTGTLRKRIVNSRVWDTAATFLSGSGTNNRIPKFTSSGLSNSEIEDNGTTIDFNRTVKIVPTGSTSTPSLLFGTSNNNGMYFSTVDGLMTSIAGSEKFRINSNYVYSSTKLGVGTTSIGTEMLNVAGSIKYGGLSFPVYEVNVDFGSDAAGSWRRIINANLQNIQYSTIGFVIEITDPKSNHASSDIVNYSVEKIKFNVACIRTQATILDSPNACYVSGPISGMIRAVRLSTGNYEIQISNRVLYQEYHVKVYAYAANGGHTINYYAGDVPTPVAEAIYNSTPGQKIEYFDKGIFTGTGSNDFGHYLQIKDVTAGNSDGPKILFEKNTPIKRWSIGSAKGVTENGFGIYEGSSTTSEGTNRLYLAAGGNIGIGTSTNSDTSEKLTINGGTNGNAGISLKTNSKSKWHINASGAVFSDSLEIGTNSTYGHLSIDNDKISVRRRLAYQSASVTPVIVTASHASYYQITLTGVMPNIYKVLPPTNIHIWKIIADVPFEDVIFTLINNSDTNYFYLYTTTWLKFDRGNTHRLLYPGESVQAMHWKNGIYSIF